MLDWVRWFVLIEAIGVALLPLAWCLFETLPSRGLAYARPLGLLLIGLPVWLLPATQVLPYTRQLVLVSAGGVALVVWGIWGRRFVRSVRATPRRQLLPLLLPEAVFLLAAAWHTFMVSLYPDIYVSEKPMNFAFINAINRSDWFPPYDPWLAGYDVNYYYFGHVLVAMLIRVSTVAPAVGFSLAGITLSALLTALIGSLAWDMAGTTSGAYGPGRSPHHRRILAASSLGAVALALFVGNLTPFFEFLKDPAIVIRWWAMGEPDWWTLPYHAHGYLSELPWRTYMMQSLHSFDLAVPYMLLLFALGVRYLRYHREVGLTLRPRIAGWVAIGLVWGGAGLISPWVVPATGLLVAVLILNDLLHIWQQRRNRRLLRGLAGYGGAWSLTFGGVLLLVQPFVRHYQSLETLWYVHMEAVWSLPLATFLLQFGVPLSVLGLVLVGYWHLLQPVRAHAAGSLLVATLCATLLLPPAGASALLSLLVCGVLVLLNIRHYRRTQTASATLVMLGIGQLLITLPFFLAIHDRDNTFFKFGFLGWLLVATGSGAGLGTLALHGWPATRMGRRTLAGVLCTLVLAGAWMPVLAGLTRTNRLQGGEVRTLDGMAAYLQQISPAEYGAITWLARHAEQDSIVLEATGPGFTPAGRVSALTGLPTVVGWFTHEYLWHEGNPTVVQEIDRRITDVARIYTTEDISEARCLLQAYDIRYVFVGGVERGSVTRPGRLELDWPEAGLAKFATFMDVVYPLNGTPDDQGATIYRRRAGADPACPDAATGSWRARRAGWHPHQPEAHTPGRHSRDSSARAAARTHAHN